MVRNPNPPQDLVTLTINVNYTVQQFGNTLQITVLNLPASINPPAPNYDFLVTYMLLPDESQTDMKTNTFNLGFSLFNGLFGPYASYSRSDLTVVSGTFSGGDTTTITKTYGFTVQRRPFTFYLERTDYESASNPYRSLRTAAEYRQVLSEDTDVLARLSYYQIEHLATDVSNDFFERTTSAEVTGHKAYPHENLDLFAGGIYTLIEVTGITSQNCTVNASLRWHMGKLDVVATASRTYSVWSRRPAGRPPSRTLTISP